MNIALINSMFPTIFKYEIKKIVVNFTYGNHSINQDSAHWPMGIKMLRPISGYLVREVNRDVMRNLTLLNIDVGTRVLFEYLISNYQHYFSKKIMQYFKHLQFHLPVTPEKYKKHFISSPYLDDSDF